MLEFPFQVNNVPDKQKTTETFFDFVTTIAALRDPTAGCPWDLEQTHESLKRYMIEEAYEATEAMSEADPMEICDELGDVLLQVVLNAQLAADNGHFNIIDVVNGITQKMLRRHPHVFGNEQERGERSTAQVKQKWKEIKLIEKKEKAKRLATAGQTADSTSSSDSGVFGNENIGKVHPASRQAYQIGKIAKTIDFDWDTPSQVFKQFLSEVSELKEEWEKDDNLSKDTSTPEKARLLSEIGDVYFSLSQVCRHLREDPETVAWNGNKKFLTRFEKLEKLALSKNIDVASIGREGLEKLWNEAKLLEKS